MVIRAGEPWGEPGRPPGSIPVAADEAALGDLWVGGVREAVLESGTLRSSTGTATTDLRLRAEVDAILVELRGPQGRSVVPVFGTMVIGTGPFGTRIAAIVTNSGFWRTRRVVPAAHPNDGTLDVLEVAPGMVLAQRYLAWRRSVRFDHLPHPDLVVRRGTEWTWTGSPCTAWVDGRRVGRVAHVGCSVRADAMRVWL
jgi:hypothetical protein